MNHRGPRAPLALAAVFCATWMLGCGSDGDPGGSTSRSHLRVPSGSEEARELEQEFQLFRGPVEPVPASVANKTPLPLASALSRAQRLPLVGFEAWVAPMAGRLCLLNVAEEGPAFGCKARTRVQREGFFIATVPNESLAGSKVRRVVGVAPDGVKAVRIHSKGVRDRTALVSENVFALRDKGKAFPESLTLIRK